MKLAALALVAIVLLFGCSVLAGAAGGNDRAGVDLDSSTFGALAKALVPVTPLKAADLRPRSAACIQVGQLSVAPGVPCIYDIGDGGVRAVSLRLAAGASAQIAVKQGGLQFLGRALNASDRTEEFRLTSEPATLTVTCTGVRCLIELR